MTWIPKHYLAAADFGWRGSLPHHDEIAIDDTARGSAHKLYGKARYAEQFIRKNTAVRHVRQAFLDCLHA